MIFERVCFDQRKTKTSSYGSEKFVKISLIKCDDDSWGVMTLAKKDSMYEFLRV